MYWPYIAVAALCAEFLLAVAVGRFLRGPIPRVDRATQDVRDAYDHVVRDRTQRMIMDRSRLIGFQTIVNCATNAPVGAWGRWGLFDPQQLPEQWFVAWSRDGSGIRLEVPAARLAPDAAS
jgi:hypothetical protein